MTNWSQVLFLHTGWANHYDGSEAPEGGHAYLRTAVGVEAENFLPVDGWCYGYAPVSRAGYSRGIRPIPKAGRTLNITKLGADSRTQQIDGITIVWTARKPNDRPVIVGLYDNATVFRSMPPQSDDQRLFIAKARASDCRMVPTASRTFDVIQKQKGFPGMAAAWFPGEHQNGPASTFLAQVAEYLPSVRKFDPVG